MTCSIMFNRNGKKVKVLYIPDEDLDYYYGDDEEEVKEWKRK